MNSNERQNLRPLSAILRSHVALDDSWDDVPAGHIKCNWTPCDFVPIPEDDDNLWREAFSDHVAMKLTEAGYGLTAPKLPEIAVAADLIALPEESAILAGGRVRVKNNEGLWVGTGEEFSASTVTSREIIVQNAEVAVLAIGGFAVG